VKRSPIRRAVRFAVIALGCAVGSVAAVNFYVVLANSARLFSDLARVPVRDVGLVLGTSRTLPDGNPNLHFANRITAAAELYRAGKVRHLLVSGGHDLADYDEAAMMAEALLAAGVPAAAITRDRAGFRTLDSVVRAREIFDVTSCVIVTQRYHGSRALEIARAHGLDAVGYCAAEPAGLHGWGPRVREVGARVAALVDLYVLHRRPRLLGEREPIVVGRR
jgi:SanA protein